jgi:SRSO17 transposase
MVRGPRTFQKSSEDLLVGDYIKVVEERFTGDRKDGTAIAHVARQYLGSVGKIDNGIVAVTSLWADERCYWPVHAVPYTPASRLPAGERDPRFRTKPQLAHRARSGRPAGRHRVPGGGG